MNIYDIAIIGAGPAGIMAAIRAGDFNKHIILIEKNNSIGKKLLITGGGRCNITNSAPLDAFIDKFGREGLFLRRAFNAFSNKELVDFFKSKGLLLKAEDKGRVFPETGKSESVLEILHACLKKSNIKLLRNTQLSRLTKKNNLFYLDFYDNKSLRAKKVILATGGVSYPATGSTGEGFKIAQRLGHTTSLLMSALVPLKTAQPWVKELQGLSLSSIRVTFKRNRKKPIIGQGELLFTHFGISGPLVLDLSGDIIRLLKEQPNIDASVDLLPALTSEALKVTLINNIVSHGNAYFDSIIKKLIPQRLVSLLMRLSKIDIDKPANQITKEERDTMAHLLKALPLTIIGSLPIEYAMVTSGGISTKEIDSKTMESKLVLGLYFSGEIIDGYGPSGGFNLQQAFSTGYLAGESAAGSVSHL